jgi:hypothetical protein
MKTMGVWASAMNSSHKAQKFYSQDVVLLTLKKTFLKQAHIQYIINMEHC